MVHIRLFIVLFTLLFAHSSWAQPAFFNLAPNGDGSKLWFSSSLRMRDTDQFAHPKIFVWDEADGVRLYDQKPATIPSVGPLWWSETAYKLVTTSVSSDGSVVATVGYADCNTGTPCGVTIERYASEVRIAGGDPLEFKGGASLSPNGRFAYLNTSRHQVIAPPMIKLVDLATGEDVEFEGLRFDLPNRHRVANDGTVLLRDALRMPDGEIRELDYSGHNARITMLNGAATKVVLADAAGGDPIDRSHYIAAYDVETGEERVLANLAGPIICDMSSDGEWIAFVDRGQAWMVNWDNTRRWRLTFDEHPVTEVALSGDGSRLFMVTNDSRILRVDVHTRGMVEVVPATSSPRVDYPYFGPDRIVPGSAYTLSVETGLPPISGLRVSTVTQHIISSDSRRISFQGVFDKETPAGWVELILADQTGSPFVSSLIWPRPMEVADWSPDWHRRPDRRIVALHEDFGSEVTRDHPAHPGEIVHVYGFGFGPVTPPVETGQPAPASPLSIITEPMACEVGQAGEHPVDVLFAGLAPGWIGLYQFDVRLPRELPEDFVNLTCGRADDLLGGGRAGGSLPASSIKTTE